MTSVNRSFLLTRPEPAIFPLSSTLQAVKHVDHAQLSESCPTPTHHPLLPHSLALAALVDARWHSLALAGTRMGTRWHSLALAGTAAPDGTTASMLHLHHCAGCELFPHCTQIQLYSSCPF